MQAPVRVALRVLVRRGRCALDKCYAYSSGARRRESVTEQQASREAHLNTNGRKGSSSSVRSDTQGVAGKTAGSRTYAQMDTRGTVLALQVSELYQSIGTQTRAPVGPKSTASQPQGKSGVALGKGICLAATCRPSKRQAWPSCGNTRGTRTIPAGSRIDNTV